MTKVLVLGCGPAGLLTAYAAGEHGADVMIYSRKERSKIFGAQWLQRGIPGLTNFIPSGNITFLMLGSAEGYAEKLYGEPLRGSGWTDHLEEPVKRGWDLRETYDRLWNLHEPRIIHKELDAEEVGRLDFGKWDHVFNCLPLWNICSRYRAHDDDPVPVRHVFRKYKVQIQPAQKTEMMGAQNRVIYNGRPEDPWFRSSLIFGVDGGYEYPHDYAVENATMIRKPLSTTCDCWPNIIRVGRYGAWDMHGLVHDGWQAVEEALR